MTLRPVGATPDVPMLPGSESQTTAPTARPQLEANPKPSTQMIDGPQGTPIEAGAQASLSTREQVLTGAGPAPFVDLIASPAFAALDRRVQAVALDRLAAN